MNIISALLITSQLALAPVGGTPEFAKAPRNLTVQANFVAGSGGATVDAYLQTSFDRGATWVDVAEFHFTTSNAIRLYNLSSSTPVTSIATPTNGSLASNTAVDGLLGPMYQLQVKSGSTPYVGASLRVDISTDDTGSNPP